MKSYLVAAVALACIAQTFAITAECNDLAKAKLQTEWKAFFQASQRDSVCQVVFRSLFSRDPAIRPLFADYNSENTASPKFKAHCLRVLGGIDNAIALLDQPDVLDAQLKHLADFHSKIPNLKKEYFIYMEEALDEILFDVLADKSSGFAGFTNYDHAEFKACFDYIALAVAGKI